MTNSDNTTDDQNRYDFDESVNLEVTRFLEFAKNSKVREEDLEDSYATVDDPENYPPEVIKIFEGRAMVPTRLILEKIKQRRIQKGIGK